MTHDNAPYRAESGFESFGLADTILKSIQHEGFSSPTEIQSGAIPPLMAGRDLMGIAQTGGGKTAAFALPVINKLLEDYQKPRQNMPKILVLAPTRELAMQIEQTFVAFSKGTKLRSLVVAGGQPYPPQTNKLRRGVDILVATPGRLIDHIGRRNIKFAETGVFILDEADRMLDMGFIDDVRDISTSLPEGHQTIMFSATMNPKVRTLSKDLLTDPVRVEIYQKTAVADSITHRLMNVSRKNKAQLLSDLLSGEGVDKALVFARTKRGADELSKQLYDRGIRSDAIHGDKRQRVREKILMNFRRGRTNVLVATDVAARGIDVDGISHVINYELPIEPENYIHRVGRTGRAGAKGIAISFCDPSDMRLLVHIEKLIKQPIEVDEDHDYHIDMKTRGKGNKGRFSRDRREQRPAARKQARPFRKDKSFGQDKPDRQGKPFRQDKPARKVAGKRYDPWTAEARKYTDDPVLGQLLGKPPKIDSRKEDKSDFVKSAPKKKPFRKKDGEAKPFAAKKVRGGKKSLNARRPHKMTKSKDNAKSKDNGGHKAFSPRKKARAA